MGLVSTSLLDRSDGLPWVTGAGRRTHVILSILAGHATESRLEGSRLSMRTDYHCRLPYIAGLHILLGVLLIASAGCPVIKEAVSGAKRAAIQAERSNQYKLLGVTYHNYHDTHRVGPPDWDSAIAFAGELGPVLEQLRESGTTVHWSYRFQDVIIGSSNFVLAYDEQAAQSGGPVLMMDGAVIPMSPDELREALAKQADIRPYLAAETGSRPATEERRVETSVSNQLSEREPAGSSASDPFEPAAEQADRPRPSETAGPTATTASRAAEIAPTETRSSPEASEPATDPLGITAEAVPTPGELLLVYWAGGWHPAQVTRPGQENEVGVRRLSDGLQLAVPRELLRKPEASLKFDPEQPRLWTDSSGEHQTVGTFVSSDGNQVTLRLSDGRERKLPLDKLSELDQRYIGELQEAR